MTYNKNLVYKVSPKISAENIFDSILDEDNEYKKEIKYLKKFASKTEYEETIKHLRKETINQKMNINENEETKLNNEQYNIIIKSLRRIEENYKNIYKPTNNYNFKELSENLIMDYRINETFSEIKKDKNGFLKNFKTYLKENNLNKETLDKNKKRYENIKNTAIRESQTTISFN